MVFITVIESKLRLQRSNWIVVNATTRRLLKAGPHMREVGPKGQGNTAWMELGMVLAAGGRKGTVS